MAVTSRAIFSYTVVYANPSEVVASGAILRALSAVNWTVTKADGSAATVYADKTGSTTVNTTGTTSTNGLIEFWAPPGEYKISISDSPRNRISNKDIIWSSVPASSGGIPASLIETEGITASQILNGTIAAADLASDSVTTAKIVDANVTTAKIADSNVTTAKIAANAVTAPKLAANVVPLGTVIDWWRASSSTAIPTGWALCDGTNWGSITNDLGLSSGTIPNLINKFTIGASATAAVNAASSVGEGAAFAPGVGGTGGSNAAKDLTHSHTINHSHGISVNSHQHSISSVGGATNSTPLYGTIGQASGSRVASSTSGLTCATLNDQVNIGSHTHTIVNHDHGGLTGSAGASGSTSSSAGVNGYSSGSDNTLASGNPSWSANPGTDFRPSHVGMLKIMKVRNV